MLYCLILLISGSHFFLLRRMYIYIYISGFFRSPLSSASLRDSKLCFHHAEKKKKKSYFHFLFFTSFFFFFDFEMHAALF